MNHRILKTIMISAAGAAMIAAPAAASTGVVSADLLNVRTAPSTDSSVIGALNWGESVTITYAPSSEWYEIYLNDGCYYVSSQFISSGSSYGYTADNYSYDNYDSYSYTDTYSYDDYSYNTGYDDSYGYGYDSYDDYEDSSSVTSTNSDTYLGNFALTAYCGCASCCGGYSDNITASGTTATAGHTVAMGGVPFGTKLRINGTVYTVEDRGTAYGTVDIYFATHAEASAFGLQYADVYQVNE